MARRTPSRLQKRREAEAVESQTKSAETKKKATRTRARSTTSRKKVKAAERKRVVWGIFTGTLKEEARFPYDQKEAAEEKLKQLLAKGKRSYFLQPIKEVITDSPAPAEEEAVPEPEEVAEAPVEEDEVLADDSDDDDDEDDDGEEE
ncbi:hypothetical protein Mal4_37340 [Maioricimonas rarisocia]|uniref:Uncharacterized protein n=1 Tax=Maioricimonas rarisocia TaxID=2528026 RepID=A0A517ZAC2_9PLAN|nr:hypothetical protein [Maioricimonas rarisocia]QDU39390.1 hypothetical protein Mal4_37340 [Maioricimonas rarisocia]